MTGSSWGSPARLGARDVAGRAGATTARMALGTALGRLREDAGLSADEVSAATGVPAGLITGMELGEAEVRLWDVAGLYSAYGVSDPADRTMLLGLAHRARCREWWHSYRDVIPPGLDQYFGLEQAASLIRCYCAQMIPALLQTPGYARAAILLRHGRMTERELDRRVDLQARRQQILHGTAPALLWAVIDEAALRRPAGTPAVMDEQIRHLIAMCELPNVTIQVLPFTSGALPAALTGGILAVLRLPGRDLPDIGYLEDFAAGRYYRSPGYLDYFRHLLNQLALQAESAGPPQRVLARILRGT